MSIRIRSILIIVITSVIIITFSVFTGIIIVRNSIDRAQEADLMLVSDIADHFLSSEIQLLKMTGERAADYLVTYDESEWNEVLLRLSSRYQQFMGISVLDKTDGVLISTGELPPQAEVISDRYISQAFQGHSRISSSVPIDDESVAFYMAVPVPGYEGRILAFTLHGMFFSEMVSTFKIWDSGHIFVDDAEGTILANIRPEWVNGRMNFIKRAETDPGYDDIAHVLRRAIAGEAGTARFSISDIPRICAFRPITGSEEGWFLGIIAPLPESPYRTVDQGLLVAGSISIFLSILVAIIVSRFIKKPFDEVATLKEEAETHSKFKSDFIANMSHEIRTPMNVILGITEILVHDESLTDNVSDGLSRIYSSGDMLLCIINDILDLSKIEAGKLELYLADYETASLINDTAVLNYMRNESKPVKFEISVDENIPSVLYGDELRIKQILNNLLSNAFKYTDKGEVKLIFDIEYNKKQNENSDSSQSQDGNDKQNVTLIITVSDTGQGMTKDQLNIMFDEFTQFNFEANRTREGTGLGMSITRNLVKLMDGEISVTSEPGKGTEFIVRLPQLHEGSEVLGSELAENLQKFNKFELHRLNKSNVVFELMPYGKVLVVDDMESNLYVTKGLMNPYELTVETVNSGFKAIDKIKDGNEYDIIFMDHMMPKMDGMEATKIIREMGYTGTIVALTANALIGQMDVFLENGFDDFISKPVDVRYLNAVLKKYIQEKQPEEVLEAVRKKMHESKRSLLHEPVKQEITPQLVEFFILDADIAIGKIDAFIKKGEDCDEEDVKSFTISTHSMKNALSHVGEKDLSEFAKKLEQAGWSNDREVMKEAPAFVAKLKAVVEKLTPKDAGDEDASVTDEDYTDLKEKLLIVKQSLETFDNKTAKETINELREKKWPGRLNKLMGEMSEQLLSGNPKEVIYIADLINDLCDNR